MALGHASGELAPANPQAGRRIVVVGGGVAGLACALSCARAGARVHVLEAQREPVRTPAHIDVVPNLLRELARLGVAEPCVRRGFVYSGLAVVDEHGAEAFRLPTERLAGPALPAAAGIALDDLMDVLAAAAQQAGAALHRGCAVRALDIETGSVRVEGGPAFEADLVVLATGAESALVRELFGRAAVSATRHAWWHALLPRPQGLERSTWMAGEPGHRLLLVPIGMERAGVAVACAAGASGSDGRELKRMLASWGALPRRIAAAIDPAQPTLLRHVAGALREGTWHRGRVLCVGAAAHALAPHFGQAAAQALEDAVVLGELVGRTDAAALPQRFTERRLPRARRLHTLTERAAHWMVRPEPATDLARLAGEIAALVAEPA